MSGAGLPEFKNPPVVEVAVSMQFDAPILSAPIIMLRWSQIRDRFPTHREAAPIHFGPAESFGEPREPALEIRISDVPPPQRLLMLDKAESRVLQMQPDAIGYSRRNLGGEREYPRYAAIIEEFKREFAEFSEFLSDEGLESPKPVQCEVTYVNIIKPNEVWREPSELGLVVPSAEPRLSDDFLPPPEHIRYASQYVIPGEGGTPIGRLYVSVEPQYPVYSMRLTVRVKPQGADMSDAIGAMDIGHEWIVRGFASLTSEEMHRSWGRSS